MQRDTHFQIDSNAQVLRLPANTQHSADHIVIPDAHLLFTANFKKVGSDLILTGQDGTKVLVTDYFSHNKHPDLVSPEGAVLSGDLVERLAGPEHPAQYAQAGAPAGAKVIGRVEQVTGNVTVQHANGLVVELKVGDFVVQGDVVQTGDGSSVGIGMVDGSAFNMDADARMVLNEYVYDSNSTSNSALISLVQGSITFVAGKVAKTGDMKIATPVATMGIRGTTVNHKFESIDGTSTITLLADKDGGSGVVAVLDNNDFSNVLYTITDVNSKLVIRPVGTGQVSTQQLPLTPADIALNAAVSRLVFDVVDSINANPLTIDIQPRSAPIPRLDSPNPLLDQNNHINGDQDHLQNIVLNETLSATVTTKAADGSLLSSLQFIFVTEVVDQKTSLTAVLGPAPPLVEAGAAGPGVPTSPAQIVISEVDGTPTFNIAAMLASGLWVDNGNGTISSTNGAFGTATLDPVGGTLTYMLDNLRANSLAQGENVTETFNILVTDNNGGAVTLPASFTVDGANDAPTVSAAIAQTVSEKDKPISVDLLANASDVDHGAVLHIANLTDELPAGVTLDTDGHTLHVDPSAYASLGEGQHAVLQFNYDVVDEFGASVAQTATITIDGKNDDATIDGSASGAVKEDTAGQTATGGTLTVSDVDTGENVFQAVAAAALVGSYGSFTFDETTGVWSYTLDHAKADHLTEGQPVQDTLTVTSADGTASQIITVDITGSNDGATIDGSASGAVKEDTAGQTATGGTLTVSDVDTGENVFQAVAAAALVGSYGSFTFNSTTGVWTYALDHAKADHLTEGQPVHDTLTVTSADGTASQTITVDITGSNDGATIDGSATGNVKEDTAGQTATGGTLTVHDVDAGENVFQAVAAAALVGTYGSFTFDKTSGAWTYALDHAKADLLTGGQVVHDTLTVTSADGTASQLIDVTITGTNDGATIDGSASGAVKEDTAGQTAIGGTLTVHDVDAGEDVFQAVAAAALVGTYGSFTFDETTGVWSYTLDHAKADPLTEGQPVEDTLTVTSADGTASQTITVDITGSNDGATIDGSATGNVKEDTAGQTATGGTLAVHDVDGGEAVFLAVAAAALVGTYGSFTFDETTGVWTYALDHAKADHLTEGQPVQDTLTVTSADGTASQIITVDITGSNDGATIDGSATGNVKEDTAGQTATGGTLQVSDVDTGENVFQAVAAAALVGSYGSFTFDETTGVWSYTLDHAKADHLTEGQPVQDTLTVTSADGTASQIITVDITGSNDGATIDGSASGAVKEDTAGQTATGGTLTVHDVDGGQGVFQAVAAAALVGSYGSFTLDETTGAWTYALDHAKADHLTEGQPVQDTLTVTSADGTASQIITVDITGSNDGATIDGSASGAVKEDTAGQTATGGTLTVSDVDTGENVFQAVAAAALVGSYGSFTFDETTGVWSYTLDHAKADHLTEGQPVQDTLTVTSADGTASQIITVDITGSNDGATIDGSASGAVKEDTAGQTATGGTLTVSDVDTGENVFQAVAAAALVGSYGSFTFNSTTGVWTYALDHAKADHLTEGQPVHDTLTVTSADGTASQTITVDITGSNDGATIDGSATGNVKEDTAGQTATGGTLTVHDVDAGENVFQAVAAAALVGTYGSFTFDKTSGAWTYALDHAKADLLTGGQVVHDTLTVTSADGTASQLIDVTITGTNDGATIDGSASGAVKEDTAGQTATGGTLTVHDVDSGQAVFQAVAAAALVGAFGSFTFNSTTGVWTYALDHTKADPLTGGQVVHDTLTVTSADGTTSQLINVTITGTNDAAVITGDLSATVVEAGGVANDVPGTPSASGNLHATDVDSSAAFVAQNNVATSYGHFTINNTGAWNYTLDNDNAAVQSITTTNAPLHDLISVATADGTTKQVDITINGANDAPQFVPHFAGVANGGFETGDFTGWTLAGAFGDSIFGPQTVITTDSHSGQYAIGLGAVGSDGIYSQDIQTTAGQHYELDFWLLNRPAIWDGSNGITVPNDFNVIWNGQTVLALVNSVGPQGYTEFSFDVVGTGGTSHLEFDVREDPSEFHLDDITLTPIEGSVTKDATVSGTETASGTLNFADVDLSDHHTASIKFLSSTYNGASYAGGQLGLLNALVTTDTTGTGTGGVVTWNFSVDDSSIHFLGQGQTIAETFAVTVDDGHGGTDTQNITVTIAGTDHLPAVNDDHVITNVSGGSGTQIKIPDAALLFNDVDADSDPISITGVSAASSGSVSHSSGTSTVTFTDNNTNGGGFTYTGATPAPVASDTGAVTIDRVQAGQTQLDGTAASEILIGRDNAADTIVSNGGNDVMIGGTGNDTFIFSANLGHAEILDFQPGADVIDIDHTIFANFVDLIARAGDDGHGDTVIATADTAHSITLKGVATASLHVGDFNFV